MSRTLLSLLFALLTVFPVLAQSTQTGSLQGTVVDSSGAVIQNAMVELFASGTRVARTQTDDRGVYQFDRVNAGTYELHVQYHGFGTHVEKLTLAGGINETPEIRMSAEAATETVTVNGEVVYSEPNAVSGTRMDIPLRDVPQNIAVINNNLLQAQAITSMQDAVRNVPGVNVHLGEGRRDQVLIRGFSAINDQYVDGFRDDSPYYRDLSNVERIEVVKGPASVLYGRGSSGGIINRVTKSPMSEGVLAEVDTMAGSYGTKRVATDLGMPIVRDKLSFRVTGAAEDSGFFRHDTGLSRYALSPSLLWRPSSRTNVVFQSDNLYDDRIPDRGIPSLNGVPAAVDIATYYGDPATDFMRNKVYGQSLRVEHHLDRWTLRNNFRHSFYDNNFSNTQPNSVDLSGPTPMVTRQQYNTNSDQRNIFNQTEASTSARLLFKHNLLMGAEYGWQTRDALRYTGTAAPVDLVNPVLTPSIFNTIPSTNNIFNGTVVGFYVQDMMEIAQHWKALVGGRFDYYKQTLNDRSSANADLSRIDRAFSPRAGLVYQPTAMVSLYANFSRSFQPSGEGLSLAANAAELKPETTENYEVGGKFNLIRSRLDTTVSLFRLDRNNVKTTDPSNPAKLLPIGVQRTDGFEISMSGRVIERLEIYGGYAWLDASILRSNSVSSGVNLEGKAAALVPRNSFNLWSTYRFDNGFGFGAGIFYNDVRYAESNNLVLLPAYTRVDATMFYRKRHYEVALNLRNVGNIHYYDSAHSNYQIMPGAPINGSLSTRFRW